MKNRHNNHNFITLINKISPNLKNDTIPLFLADFEIVVKFDHF